MKKLLMVLLSLVLVFSIVGIVSADEIHVGTDDSDKREATMTVKLGVEQMYVITLPTEVVLDPTGETVNGGSVNITDLVLLNSESLNIYVQSANDWNVKYTDPQTSSDHFISYRMERTGWGTAFTQALDEGPALFATVPMQTYNHENPPSFGLTFTKTGPISTFGAYLDTLTFTVSTSNTVSQGS